MKILELVRNGVIETQEDLAADLRRFGIDVTQATVSRDIKELHLVKVATGDGRYRYAVPIDPSAAVQKEKMRRYFRDSLLSAACAENLLVLKTLPGTAPAVGAAFDNLEWSEAMGTVAGDDTVLVVARDKSTASDMLTRLQDLLH
jgi:transcriptional regulator of arginine metabolism